MKPRFAIIRAVLVGALLPSILTLDAQTARVRIRVTDPAGYVVTSSSASLLGPDEKPARIVRANTVGEIVMTDLSLGECRFVISAPGFHKKFLTVTLSGDNETKIEAALEVCGGILQTC